MALDTGTGDRPVTCELWFSVMARSGAPEFDIILAIPAQISTQMGGNHLYLRLQPQIKTNPTEQRPHSLKAIPNRHCNPFSRFLSFVQLSMLMTLTDDAAVHRLITIMIDAFSQPCLLLITTLRTGGRAALVIPANRWELPRHYSGKSFRSCTSHSLSGRCRLWQVLDGAW